MHMADALVSPAVGGTMLAVSAAAIACSAAKIKKEDLAEKKLPIMGIMGAFVFAAQMINFTIPGTGSSGHIGGGMLLAAVLGPFPALITISAVLIIQCLLFADGGLLALGCNIFNMGVIPCLLVYPLIFRPIAKKMNPKSLSAASVISVTVALQLGAFSVVLETLISKITALPFSTFVLFMQPIHLAIGLVEGIITAAVLCFILKARPEILDANGENSNNAPVKNILIALTVLTLAVGGILSMFASSYPDGLEWSIAGVTGSDSLETDGSSVYGTFSDIQEKTSVMPDYDYKSANGKGSSTGTSVAGIAGGAAVFALSAAAGAAIKLFKKARSS